jgi:amidase
MREIWQLSATELAGAVRNRRLSATEVTEAHLERIAAVNPALNAVVQQFPDEALAAARAVDARIGAGEDAGPLCGVPVTIKINTDQKGHASSNGLTLLKDTIAQHDSPVVANIRKAGGIIVGRSNTPAFSLRWFTKNNLHGQTLNPRDARLTPGGSSGGAAAAVASGICALGHGTDIAGSIRYPAYACGLHGLRPTIGRIPAFNASGAERFIGAQIMAVSGPIARSIADIRLSLAAMARFDPRDPWWVAAPHDPPEYPRRAALSIAPDAMPVAPEVRAALRDAAQKLAAAGWEVDEIACPPMRAAADINALLWMAEMRHGTADMIGREGDADAAFVYEQMTRDMAAIDIDVMMKALRDRAALVRQWQVFHQTYPVLICPVSGELPFAQQQDVASPARFAEILEAQLPQRALAGIGLPGLTVTTGAVGKTPVGVQLVGARLREDILLDAGEVIEAAGHAPAVCDPQ